MTNLARTPPAQRGAGGSVDEELDQVADTAVTALKEILARFEISDPVIEEYEGDEGEIILDVVGGDLGLLIGRHGRTLDALQTAVGAITTRQLGFRHPVVVDIEGYRHRRRQKVEDIARRAAEKAARQRKPVRLRPMTAYERRIVHVALRNDSRVVTGSEGDGAVSPGGHQAEVACAAYRSPAEGAATAALSCCAALLRKKSRNVDSDASVGDG